MINNIIHLIQEASWLVLTGLCMIFVYTLTRWVLNTYFPHRYVRVNFIHNKKLVSSHNIDLKSSETLIEQLKRLSEREGDNG
jgi:hypothetical protein